MAATLVEDENKMKPLSQYMDLHLSINMCFPQVVVKKVFSYYLDICVFVRDLVCYGNFIMTIPSFQQIRLTYVPLPMRKFKCYVFTQLSVNSETAF